MEKLRKTARVLDGFARTFRVIFIAVTILLSVGLVVATCYYLSVQEELDAVLIGGDLHLNLGAVTLDLTHIIPTAGKRLVPVALIMISGAIMSGISSVEAHILHRILSPMAGGRPFESSVSDNLKRLGWMSLVQALVYNLAQSVAVGVELRLFEFGSFLNPEFVKSYSVNFRLELATLLIPAALFLLSLIFRYGEELQRQSDETL